MSEANSTQVCSVCGGKAARTFVPLKMYRGHSIFPEGGTFVEHISENGKFFESKEDLKRELKRQNKVMPGIFD